MSHPSLIDLSVVIPVFNEEESVALLCQRLHEALSVTPHHYEILLVDDGSSDRTWELLLDQCRIYPCFRILRFRRNFGQTAAMAAGFAQARGEVIVTLDADLQNPPEDIPRLLEAMSPEVDVVSGWRKQRHDKFLSRRLPSMIANAIISKITGVHLHDYGCTLKAYRREAVNNVRLYGEMHRFIPALVRWKGGGVKEVAVSHEPRRFGTSKYGIGRTFRVVLDLITVKFLMRYSMGPMQIFGKVGGFFGMIALLLFGTMFLDFFIGGHTGGETHLFKRPAWVMSAFMFTLFCMQFISMGLLAELQIRTYHEAQDKPTYVIRETAESSPST